MLAVGSCSPTVGKMRADLLDDLVDLPVCFDEVFEDPCFGCLGDVLRLAEIGEYDRGDIHAFSTQHLEHGHAVHFGHIDVHDHKVRWCPCRSKGLAFLTILPDGRLETRSFKRLAEHTCEHTVVFNDQNIFLCWCIHGAYYTL